MALFAKLDHDKAVEDAAAALDFLRAHPACTGRCRRRRFCLGGRLAYLLAVRYRPDVAVGYYGVGIERALDEGANLSCPLMLHIAGLDKYSPPPIVDQIRAALAPDPRVAIHVYPDADHAFARSTGAHYNPAAAELANLRTLELLVQTLIVNHTRLRPIWPAHRTRIFHARHRIHFSPPWSRTPT